VPAAARSRCRALPERRLPWDGAQDGTNSQHAAPLRSKLPDAGSACMQDKAVMPGSAAGMACQQAGARFPKIAKTVFAM